MTTMNDKTWNRLCDAFHSYWIENNDNGAWPKHRTTLTGSWRHLVDDDPDPSWTAREAARYNAAQAHARRLGYSPVRATA